MVMLSEGCDDALALQIFVVVGLDFCRWSCAFWWLWQWTEKGGVWLSRCRCGGVWFCITGYGGCSIVNWEAFGRRVGLYQLQLSSSLHDLMMTMNNLRKLIPITLHNTPAMNLLPKLPLTCNHSSTTLTNLKPLLHTTIQQPVTVTLQTHALQAAPCKSKAINRPYFHMKITHAIWV